MKTSELITGIADEMGALLDANEFAISDERVVRQLRFLAAELGGHSAYAAEKALALCALAEIFYSAQAHWKYPGGASRLRVEMRIDLLGRIRNEAQRRQLAGD